MYKAANRFLITVESLSGIYLIRNSKLPSINYEDLMPEERSFEEFEIDLMMQLKDIHSLYLLSDTNYGDIISKDDEEFVTFHQSEIDYIHENHLLWEKKFIQPKVHKDK